MIRVLDVPPIDDPRQYKATVAREWESYMLSGTLPTDAVRGTIRASWDRCRERGVDPLSFKAPTLDLTTLSIDPELAAAARMAVDKISPGLEQTRHLIAICDERGRIFEVGGDRSVIRAALSVNIDRGGVWAEDLVGTNGIGTSLAERRPVQIFATEHFCMGWQDWTCSAAPVLDPAGKLVGGVNISSHCAPVHPHTLEFTASIAREIEQSLYARFSLRRGALREAFVRFETTYPNAALVAVDRSGAVVAASRRLKRPRNAPGLAIPLAQLLELVTAGRRKLSEPLLLPNGREVASEWHPVLLGQEVAGMIGVVELPPEQRRREGGPAEPQWDAWEGAPVRSEQMRSLLGLAQRLAATDLPALILGETGTGKEMVARAIHRASGRAAGPFVGINCGALAPDLIASELFGYEHGAFTGAARAGSPGKFELAHGGTLLLDEVGDLPPQAQVALLRVLDMGEVMRVGAVRARRVDVRLIAATNRDLVAAVRAGRFREDLYHRLNTVELLVPPLRERTEDIPALVEFFLAGSRSGAPVRVAPEAMALLRQHRWPGNVRELRNALQRAQLTSTDGLIRPENLHLRPAAPEPAEEGGMADSKRRVVLAALEQAGGNVTRAARSLGVSRGTIYRYLSGGSQGQD